MEVPGAAPVTFLLYYAPSLTPRKAGELLEEADQDPSRPIFVAYRRSGADGRELLREAGVSFAGDDGRVFVTAPGIFVDRDAAPRASSWSSRALAAAGDGQGRNPFAKRSSRIPRWLLLNNEPVSRAELAEAVELNPAACSRVIDALEDAAFLTSTVIERRRVVELQRPRALLEAWLPNWERRRVPTDHWDIGAQSVDEVHELLAGSVTATQPGWALGGLAGAALVQRAVEPGDVLLWAKPSEAERLAELLQPEPGRPGRGGLRISFPPDPWVLELSREINGLPVADSAQLWLDCASEGERALEAADTLAKAHGWT